MTVDANGNKGADEPNPADYDLTDAVDQEPWVETPLETEQLALDDTVRLPWLEADEDEEEDFAGRGGGQLAMLLVLGLGALALIGGGIWWALGQRNETAVADGSVIAAPEQPYKEAPEDPGGKTFAGTGDTSFVVAKGQTRSAQLDQRAAPRTATAPNAPAKPAAAGAAPAAKPAPSGVGVQVAAYSSRASAEAGWTRLSSQYELLSGLNHRVVEGTADIGTVYRLQVLAADVAAARALCGRLKDMGLACQVKN